MLKLLPHQVTGIQAILDGFDRCYVNKAGVVKKAKAFLLYDDMGMGKTIQALSVICRKKEQEEGLPNLIVCPASLVKVWTGRDFKRYFSDNLEATVVTSKLSNFSSTSNLVYIVSYTTLTTIFKNKQELQPLFSQRWGVVVMDEIHLIRNAQSVRCKAIREIKCEFRLGLTGTPAVNNGRDMVTILKYGLGFEDFNWSLSPNSVQFQYLLETFTLGRAKSEIFASDKTDETVIIDWVGSEAERSLYRLIKQERYQRDIMTNTSFFKLIHSLKKVCLKPKMQFVLATLGSRDEKVVVVCSYKSFLKTTMRDFLTAHGIESLLLSGDQNSVKQAQQIQVFHDSPTVRVLLVVKQAGALGINLQEAASTIIIMDPHFNAATDDQAAARIDRIGQKNHVRVYRLLMKDSVDVALAKMQESKKQLVSCWERKSKKKKRTLDIVKMHLSKYDTL